MSFRSVALLLEGSNSKRIRASVSHFRGFERERDFAGEEVHTVDLRGKKLTKRTGATALNALRFF